jgi:hypothetical protein
MGMGGIAAGFTAAGVDIFFAAVCPKDSAVIIIRAPPATANERNLISASFSLA